MRSFVALSALILFASSTAFAQAADVSSTGSAQAHKVREEWVARYNGPSNSTDGAIALKVDERGNTYVTGSSASGIGTNYDILKDYATLKYNPNGNLIWEQRYNGPSNTNDAATALAVDNQGNVYVTGNSEGNGTGADYATVKYDRNGTLLWEQRYNGLGNQYDSPSALAVDSHGNVYVTGVICPSVDLTGGWCPTDYATLKYASNGTLLWEQRYHGPGNSLFNGASAITVDRQGNVYVTGLSEDSNNNPDYVTIKYSQ